jgi:hypothetical protein
MEGVLHVEPIMRRINPPLTIGHTEGITFGKKLTENEEDDALGDPAVFMQLGSPLETVDLGSTQTCIPLVKTIEYMTDDSSTNGFVYSESIHYLKDQKYLIPLRTKIQSGRSEGLRIAHLPSLNFARTEISGNPENVCEVRSEIVSELVDKDKYFLRNKRPVVDWLREELVHTLASSSITDIRFDTERLNQDIYNFIDEVERVPHEMNTHHLKRVMSKISLEGETIPVSFFSNDIIHKSILEVKQRVVPNSFNFKSVGRLPIDRIPNLEYNPLAFQGILGKLDRLSLTDYNIDVIVDIDHSISFVKEHVAVDRFADFSENSGSLLGLSYNDIVNEETLRQLLDRFSLYHSAVKGNDELMNILQTEPIKIKIIKTMSDEALILLYRYNSTSKDDPLCGVYFDIALQSLAPLTVWKPNPY